MNEDDGQCVKLQQAQKLIYNTCSSLPAELVALADCPGRFPIEDITALESLPGYDQSLRDGYAVGKLEAIGAGGGDCSCRVVDEVAAGDTRKLVVQPDEAIRIMTGGLLPVRCTAVIPDESCTLQGNVVRFSLSGKNKYIHRKGSELVEGQVLLAKGLEIGVESVILLAGVGYRFVEVARRPRVSFVCTGSELVASQEETGPGKKKSANNPLLQALIKQAGAVLQDQQKVQDDPGAVTEVLVKMAKGDSDILLSTGGMGPGKFDLIEDAFRRAGGRVIYRSIHLRPGKATLFGVLGKKLFFGLPGPPRAVYLLFNELVWPAILKLQGARSCSSEKTKAILTTPLPFAKENLPYLKSGKIFFEDGRLLVRPTVRLEAVNCYIHRQEGCRETPAGEFVTVHLLRSVPIFNDLQH